MMLVLECRSRTAGPLVIVGNHTLSTDLPVAPGRHLAAKGMPRIVFYTALAGIDTELRFGFGVGNQPKGASCMGVLCKGPVTDDAALPPPVHPGTIAFE